MSPASAFKIGMILFLLTTPANAALFAVASAQFSGFVDEGNYAVAEPATNGIISKEKLHDGVLYFSFRVIGGAKAIEHLKKNGSLDVKVIAYSGLRLLGTYQCGISAENWRKNKRALIDEFLQKGVFNWRTYVQTEQIENSSITVKISDANSDYAAPIDVTGAYEETVNIVP